MVSQDQIQRDNIRIAVIEDDRTIREGLQMLISGSHGFSCIAAFASAEEALEGWPSPPPDVALMDINLPGMNGIDCLVSLKARDSSVQFIMLTIFEASDAIFKSLTAGASGYLLKQTPPAKLLEAIEDVYRGGSPMSGEIARKVVQSFQNPPGIPVELSQLSKREEEVLALLAKGFLYKEIAEKLFISIQTVRAHIRKIYEKLQVNTRTEATLRFLNK
ncbi:MAG: response regulator transcription factor [Bacteroidales bacterium]|jgi:DNA-binding NarL/FixJ family response regulator|nr:response regulator transcription factor [Bacteroidales bacterium]